MYELSNFDHLCRLSLGCAESIIIHARHVDVERGILTILVPLVIDGDLVRFLKAAVCVRGAAHVHYGSGLDFLGNKSCVHPH